MTPLGDVLELLHGAAERYACVRLELRDWRHAARGDRAFQRHNAESARHGAVTISVSLPGAGDRPETTEVRERIVWRPPDRLRHEVSDDDPSGHRLVVRDGAQWWSYDQWHGAVTNLGSDLEVGVEDLPHRELLDPAGWLGSVGLEVTGATTVAGRAAITVRASRRRDGADLDRLPWGADHHDIAIDGERGVVLRIASIIDGEPFAVTEVLSIAFDEEPPPETFRFTAPPGEELRPIDWPPCEDVTLDEAAREAPFTVLAPRRVPHGAELSVTFGAGSSRPPQDPYVLLHYVMDDVGAQVSISLAAADPDGDLDVAEPAEEVVHEGRAMRVRELGGQRQVALELHGTRAMLISQSVPLETLVEMAASLAPASTEPPRLVDAY